MIVIANDNISVRRIRLTLCLYAVSKLYKSHDRRLASSLLLFRFCCCFAAGCWLLVVATLFFYLLVLLWSCDFSLILLEQHLSTAVPLNRPSDRNLSQIQFFFLFASLCFVYLFAYAQSFLSFISCRCIQSNLGHTFLSQTLKIRLNTENTNKIVRTSTPRQKYTQVSMNCECEYRP